MSPGLFCSAVLVALLAGPPIAAEDLAFALPGAHAAIGTHARWREIRDLASGGNRLLGGDWPIAAIELQSGARLEAQSVAPSPEGLRVRFGAGSGAIVFELRSHSGDDVARIELVRAPLAIEGELGTILNAAWDGRFGAAVLALDASTDSWEDERRWWQARRANSAEESKPWRKRFGFREARSTPPLRKTSKPHAARTSSSRM